MLIAAQYSGAQIKIADDFVFGETNKSEAFLKKFPLGKVSLPFCQATVFSLLSRVCYIESGKPAGTARGNGSWMCWVIRLAGLIGFIFLTVAFSTPLNSRVSFIVRKILCIFTRQFIMSS